MLVAEAVETGAAIATILGVCGGVCGALATVVIAWATLRSDVRHGSTRMDAIERRQEQQDGRIGRVERWRERVRGATAKHPHYAADRSSTDVDDDG